ncbi:hypothetical protein SAMN05216315_105111 [Nitrosospira sp. Nsp18]|nr:hypothetical protein SAMN05216315_105111 [Nitrosospira sp. Nsp18]
MNQLALTFLIRFPGCLAIALRKNISICNSSASKPVTVTVPVTAPMPVLFLLPLQEL